MNEENQLKDRINELVRSATLEELRVLLITVRGVLRK